METIKVKNPEELGALLTDMNTKLEAVTTEKDEMKGKLDDALSKLGESEERKAEVDKQLEETKAQIENLTIITKKLGSWKEQDTPEAKAHKIGEFVQAIYEARHGSKVAQAKLFEMGAGMIKENIEAKEQVFAGDDIKQKAGLSSAPLTGDNAAGSYYGSYTLPVEYRSELFRIALDNSMMMGKVRSFPVPAITSYAPTTTDELAFTKLTNQDTDKTEDTITFGQLTLTTEIYAAYLAIVEEFFEDTLINIGELVRDMFGEAWGKKFDTLCLSDSTYGAINTTNINQCAMDTGDSSFDDLTPEYLHDMIKELDSRGKRAGNEYFMHVTIWDKIRTAKNADGDYYFGPITGGMEQRAWGYPVVLTDGMPDSGDDAASTDFVAFGNAKRILNGVRVPFEFKIYDQTQSAMESGQIFLRVRTRQAFVLSNPTAWVKLTTAAS